METFHFFCHGPFSQWYPSPGDEDGIEYNCAEQYMMAEKALLFGDLKACERIMRAVSPKEQKAIGRTVRGFQESIWNHHCKDIVFQGNLAKFSAHEDLRQLLLATAPSTLVEASPYDCVWGIGLSAGDPRALSRVTWRGKNWLGEVLTAVRDRLA